MLVWLTAAFGVVLAGLSVGIAAALTAVASGQKALKAVGDTAHSPLVTSPIWISLGTLGNEIAVLVALVVWMKLLKPDWSRVFPIRRPSVVAVIGTLLVVFGLSPLAEVMGELTAQLIGAKVTASQIVVNAARGAGSGGFVLLLFALAVMPAIAEEALFRGFITASFERRFITALVVPSVMFALFHLEPTQIAGTVILGFGFAAGRLCTGSLVPGVIAHFVYNGVVILTIRYSDTVADRRIQLLPVVLGLVVAAGGAVLLARERRALLTELEGARESLPSWWF